MEESGCVISHSAARSLLNYSIGMLVLNFILALPLLTSAINGFDSSLMNGTLSLYVVSIISFRLILIAAGLQLIPDFVDFFHIADDGTDIAVVKGGASRCFNLRRF